MRTIKRSTAFRRDLRRVLTNTRYRAAAELIQTILESLAADIPLQAAQKDHTLSGERGGYRDCHVRPDLVLIYRKTEDNMLHLVRLGSHSDLFK